MLVKALNQNNLDRNNQFNSSTNHKRNNREMGESRTLLITKKNIHLNNIQEDQTYYKDNDYFIFPFEISFYETNLINENFRVFNSINEIIEKRNAFSKNVNSIIEIIKYCKVRTFLLVYDDGDLCTLIVKDNKIYQETDWDSIEDILGYFDGVNNPIDFNKY